MSWRVQSYPELIDEFKKINGYYISTKMDGTSVTMYRKDDHFGVCEEILNMQMTENAMWKYAHENGIPDRIKENNLSDLAIQGEFCGAGIQKNRLKLKKTGMVCIYHDRSENTQKTVSLRR